MSKASLADDEPRDGGDSQDMMSRIYTIIRDYGKHAFLFFCFLPEVCKDGGVMVDKEASGGVSRNALDVRFAGRTLRIFRLLVVL